MTPGFAPCEVCGLVFQDQPKPWRVRPCLGCGGAHLACFFCEAVFAGRSGAPLRACPDECRAAAEVLGLSGPSSKWPIGRVAELSGGGGAG